MTACGQGWGVQLGEPRRLGVERLSKKENGLMDSVVIAGGRGYKGTKW